MRATPRIARAMVLIAVAGLSLVVYWRTAYPTITWWDSSGYSVTAATLGVYSSPGSLLLTILGWLVTRVPLGMTAARELNLFAGALAATTVTLVYLASLRLHHIARPTPAPADAVQLGAALGGLTFGFTTTLWEHAGKFTPYVLTALFTALLLWVMLRWWEEAERADSWRWLALLGFLFGLDFSVHRTNGLLIPAAIIWVLVRDPRTLLRPRDIGLAVSGLLAGLAIQLLVIPIAMTTSSPINMFEPTTLRLFWDYVSLKQTGGHFLVVFWPRNSGLWDNQVSDFLRALRDNFASPQGLWPIGMLPAAFVIAGLAALLRRNRRLALGVSSLLVLQAVMTVAYFNIPANYFRSLDRHYLPVMVTLAVVMSYGMAETAAWLWSVARGRAPRATAVAAAVALLAMPVAQLYLNWRSHDASRRYFTRDYADNALKSLPPNAIYFTVGDNDTFPVMYLQSVEGVRRDVTIVNTSMATGTWFAGQLLRRDPSFPATAGKEFTPADIIRANAWRRPITFSVTAGDLGAFTPYSRIEGLHLRTWPDTTHAIDRELVRTNLLERYNYRGYADSSVTIDRDTPAMAYQYFVALRELMDADIAAKDTRRCNETESRLLALLPPERLGLAAVLSSRHSTPCDR